MTDHEPGPARAESDRAASGYVVWGALVAILVLGPLLAMAALILTDVGGRLLIGRPVVGFNFRESLPGILALVVGCGLLVGIPYGLVRSFARDREGTARIRSALSLWPGLPIAVLVVIAGSVLLVTQLGSVAGVARMQANALEQLLGFAVVGVMFLLIVSAGSAGGRPAHGPSVVATRTVAVFLIGALFEQSIIRLAVAALVPSVLVALLSAIAYAFAPWRAVLRIQASAAALAIVAVFMIPGVITPTEFISLLILPAFVAWLVRGIITKRLWATIDIAAIEVVAIMVAIVAATTMSRAAVVAGWPNALTQSLPPDLSGSVVLLAAVAAFGVLSIVLSPVLALGIVGPLTVPLLAQTGLDPLVYGVLLALLFPLATIVRRGSKQAGDADPEKEDLGIGARVALVLIILGIAAAVVLVPGLALFLPQATIR